MTWPWQPQPMIGTSQVRGAPSRIESEMRSKEYVLANGFKFVCGNVEWTLCCDEYTPLAEWQRGVPDYLTVLSLISKGNGVTLSTNGVATVRTRFHGRGWSWMRSKVKIWAQRWYQWWKVNIGRWGKQGGKLWKRPEGIYIYFEVTLNKTTHWTWLYAGSKFRS